MSKVEANGSSASEAAEARLKSTDNGDKKPAAHSVRQRDTYRPFPSICLEERGYGMFSEGASNAPYAGYETLRRGRRQSGDRWRRRGRELPERRTGNADDAGGTHVQERGKDGSQMYDVPVPRAPGPVQS